MEPPVRTQVRTQCCCRMQYGSNLDSCGELTSGPDEPICRACVEQEHPQSEFFDPVIKR